MWGTAEEVGRVWVVQDPAGVDIFAGTLVSHCNILSREFI